MNKEQMIMTLLKFTHLKTTEELDDLIENADDRNIAELWGVIALHTRANVMGELVGGSRQSSVEIICDLNKWDYRYDVILENDLTANTLTADEFVDKVIDMEQDALFINEK